MHRFFLPAQAFQSGRVLFPAETAHQIYAVLRLKPGQHVLALDNQGSQYEVALEQVERSAVQGAVVAVSAAPGEPVLPVGVYFGVTQREKLEWILQKCTEVGASELIPVITERALVQDAHDDVRKMERRQRILQEAAEQCGRGRIPRLGPVLTFAQALQDAQRFPYRLMPWEGVTYQGDPFQKLAKSNVKREPVAIFIGPEGGFSAAEVELARQADFAPVSLGPRILRMETAAVVAVTMVMYASGGDG